MIGFEVDIVAFVDNSQPGWVKCVFKDVHDKEWTIIEKMPVVSDEDLNSFYTESDFLVSEISIKPIRQKT